MAKLSKHAPNGPFEIMINNRQRMLLIKLIRTALLNPKVTLELLAEPTNDVYPDNQLEEANSLLCMLSRLPDENEEFEGPSTGHVRFRPLHGFCL